MNAAPPVNRTIIFFFFTILLLALAVCLFQPTRSAVVHAQSTLGGPIPNLTTLETSLFNQGFQAFIHLWDPQQGLGAAYNQEACSVCHKDPVIGGNSTQKITFFGTLNFDGTFNPLSSEGGPFLQAQPFQFQQCLIKGEKIPPDATIAAVHQAPQTFGAGLIDNIPPAQISAQAVDKGMGVHGITNMVLDQNGKLQVGRFGLKAQFANLLQTDASELQSEIGVTNPLFPTEDLPGGQPIPPNCSIKIEPNDDGKQLIALYHYNVYLAPNSPGSGNAHGQLLFNSVGCNLCHLPSYKTAHRVFIPVAFKGRFLESHALEDQPVNLYSDLLLHDMGASLSDGYPVGLATGSMFRTAPLWGLSTRIADGDGLLHDGRAKDVVSAIGFHGGEAAQVITNFNALSSGDQADVIAFISSL
ncbi:MAG TPA: di-heme oxidoredictase family protein [Terriglobales bacterium]|nr:di-heme oxidoredictase family protein [Terriglobales bacterium]